MGDYMVKDNEGGMGQMRAMMYMNNMQDRFNHAQGILARIIPSNLESYSKIMAVNKVRNTFGKEFFIKGYLEKSSRSVLFYDFLRDTVKNFDKNYIDNNDELKDFIYIGKIDTATFMYIATKRYVPNKIYSAMMNMNDGTDIYIYIFGRKSRKYSHMLDTIMEKTKENERAKKLLMVNSVSISQTDISVVGFEPRDIDSLIYSHDESKRIIEHIDRFLSNVDFYKSKQLLYKTGILLYGEPGTGKSTIVKALANKYNRNIIQINVTNITSIDFGELTTMINNDIYEHYIVLLEDIDTLYLKRDLEKKPTRRKKTMTDEEMEIYEDKKKRAERVDNSLNDLLQFLDSNSSPNNVIFIATTNDIDALDKALMRAGRFDLKVEVEGIDVEGVKRFAEIFEVDWTDKILEEYGDAPNGIYNQSKIQNILLQMK